MCNIDFGNTWSERSVVTIEDIGLKVIVFITENSLPFVCERKMDGFNDGLVIKSKSPSNTYISLILSWIRAHSELAICEETEEGRKFVTQDYLTIDNKLPETDDEDKYPEYLCKNEVKYYEPPFTSTIDDVVKDIKEVLMLLVKSVPQLE